MEYVAGRTNLACTIFVPYDCDNNCPFCTSKWMYRESGMFDLESKLKPEDIEKQINKLQSGKYKDYQKFSRVQMSGSDTFAYVEDDNGHFVYDNNAHKFIDITK